jgi:serine/threonine protein kinase
VIGTVFAKRYLITGFLGKGGMGEVWRAHDINQGREVALKLFPAGSLTIHAYHEARVLTLIASGNVMRVYNADTFIDVPYIATAIAEAGTTEDRAAAPPGLGLSAHLVVRWIRHCLVGLDACHAIGLVHRDIKTSNLFLNSDDWALLGDFGIAHPVDAAGRVPPGGTPITKPPEMITNGYGLLRSDLYAVGVSAYRLLAGMWPFQGADIPAIERAIVSRSYISLRDIAPHVSRRLASRIEQAMAADPADRFESALAFHAELGRPGLVGRNWLRQPPHTGHIACWREEPPTMGPGHEVCAIDRGGGRVDIEARFAASGRRLPAHCYAGIKESELPVKLRAVFDHL